MREKKFKIFFDEESWERIISRGFYAMCLDHMAEFINRSEVKRREFKLESEVNLELHKVFKSLPTLSNF